MKTIDILLDKAWSAAVKARAGFKCEYCGTSQGLESHHIFSRRKMSVRWDLDNGVCLCWEHHTGDCFFSAHNKPAEFMEWICNKRDIEPLNMKARQTAKYTQADKEEMLIELKK